MYSRPAGDSSDEDEDYYGSFVMHGDDKNEKRRQPAVRDLYVNSLQNRLYTAITCGDLDVVKTEFDKGIDVNVVVNVDYTALYLAVTVCNAHIVEELIKRGADVTANRDGFTTLMAVCNCTKFSGTAEKVLPIAESLIKHGVDVKAIDRKRRTAFMLACEQGFLSVVQMLLPYSELEAQDNQGWTALFFAVNANKVDVVQFLLTNDANIHHIDVRNNNIKYYATLNDFREILALFPQDESDVSPSDFMSVNVNYEEVLRNLSDNERPAFPTYVKLILYSMRCESLIKLFMDNNVSLAELLVIDEPKLIKLGVNMSFQRNRILEGLFRFHKYPWKRNSMPKISTKEIFTSADLFITTVFTIKHITTMESTVKYIQNNIKPTVDLNKAVFINKIDSIRKKLRMIQNNGAKIHCKALQIDKKTEAADTISKVYKFPKNRFTNKVLLSFAGISSIFVVTYCKNKFT